MNSAAVRGSWNEQKGRLKKKFADLTDNDLMFAEAGSEEMIGKLQIKLGMSREELQRIMASI